MKQHIQYCKAQDGTQLALSLIGKGTPIVRTSHWLTHLEYNLTSPVWRPLYLGLSHRHSLVRYDGRGLGLSQRDITDLSFEQWVSDLATVVDALALQRFVLLGVSQGASVSIQYAIDHPERVSHLILYGGFARGQLRRSDPEKSKRLLELTLSLVREGWGGDNEEYRQWFTSQFIPSGTAELYHWFNDMQRHSATPDIMGRFL